nr:MFS transporter [Prauserella isguenensis]
MPGYLAGALAARTGDEMSGPALLLAAVAVTGSITQGPAVLTALTAAAAVGGPVIGVLLDRTGRPGPVLAGALAGYAAGLGLVVLCLGHVSAPVAVAAAVPAGLLSPVVAGGWSSQLPAVAGSGLDRASRLDAMTFSVASLAGPAVAGLVGGQAGVVVSVAVVAVGVPAALALPSASAGRGRGSMPGSRVRTEVVAGLRAIAGSTSLSRATTVSVVSYVGVGMFVVCCPVLGMRWFGDADRGALLLAVLAAAGLLANAVLARRKRQPRPDSTLLVSTFVLGGGVLLAVAPGPGFAIAAAAVCGIGEGPQLAALFAVRHREADAEVRARVFMLGASLKIGGIAAGTALAGALLAWSLTVCLLVAAGTQLLAAGLYPLWDSRQRCGVTP